jgi:large subunit ribosomal protein L5
LSTDETPAVEIDEAPLADETPVAEEAPAPAEESAAPEAPAAKEPAPKAEPVPPARLKAIFENEIRPRLQEEFGYGSVMEHPRLLKITLNMGVGDAKQNTKALDEAVEQMGIIAGQKPAITKARKSIAQFKLREGMPIGCRVTLRGQRMWEFLDRLTSVALPRIRDFRGVNPDSFDGRGNYNLGLKEQTIFPEIDYDGIDQLRGLNVTITTTAKTDDEARSLLRHLGMPFSAEGYSADELQARRRQKMRKFGRGKGRGRR